MKLRRRFQLSVAASVGTVLVLLAVLAWARVRTARATEAHEVAIGLQKTVLERAGLRAEYMVHGTERARLQWHIVTARLEAELDRADAVFVEPRERAIVAEMAEITDRGKRLFHEIVALSSSAAPGTRETALRERLRTRLLMLVYDLSSSASELVESASERERRTDAVASAFAFIALGGVLVMLLASAALTGRLVERRVAELRHGADLIASGQLAHRIDLGGDDELAELGRNFDSMAARLADQFRLLEAANRELEAFSYSVSHDLRAPLRHVAGFVSLLETRARNQLDEKSRHYLSVITEATTTMGQLIDALLSFSRAGRVELAFEEVDMRSLVEAVRAELDPPGAGRWVEWTIGPLPVVRADPVLLRQVWVNLLSNAFKFSADRAPARIEIGSSRDGGELRMFVRDNGVGFEMKYLDKLFGVFQRLHRVDEFEGTGVGLANVQRIVHRHGGRVWAEGVPGEGATFWFSLPGTADIAS